MKIITKNYEEKYDQMIFSLYKKCFGKTLNPNIWSWRFNKCVFGNPFIKMAFANEELIAFYLLRPVQLNFQDKRIKALLSMNTMTHPDFSGKGIMTKLATEVYGDASDNYSAVIGFANTNSRYMFTKKLGFRELAIIPEICFDINNTKEAYMEYSFVQINSFNELHSNYFQTICKTMPKFIVPRTHDYLNWRFIINPEFKYYCYNITKGNEFVGYYVLKNYQNEKCHIVDFLVKNDVGIFESMIKHAIQFCKKNKIKKLTLWSNETLPLYKFLLKHNFYNIPTQTFFVIKSLSSKIHYHELEKLNNWYLTMSDSDVY